MIKNTKKGKIEKTSNPGEVLISPDILTTIIVTSSNAKLPAVSYTIILKLCVPVSRVFNATSTVLPTIVSFLIN